MQGVIPESLRLFALCDAMNWSHLPVQGGLYDQHPQLLDEWMTIFSIKSDVERRKAAQQRRQADSRKSRTRP